MGCNTAQTTENTSSQAFIDAMGSREKSIVDRLQSLGMSQADALDFVIQQSKQAPGVIGLQGSDQALLDQAYGGAEANLRRQANILGQDMAGTRGLNRSDTPVSESVLREMLPQFNALNAQKASESLGLGLNLAQLRQQNLQNLLYGSQVSPSSLTGLAQRMQNERFARAKQLGTNTGRSNPGLMTQIGQGMQLASGLGSALTGGLMPSGGGMPGMGGGGGGGGGGGTYQPGYDYGLAPTRISGADFIPIA